MDGRMYLGVWNEVGRAGSQGWVLMHLYGRGRGCHLPASLNLSFVKCTFKRDKIVLINDAIYPLKPLQLLV